MKKYFTIRLIAIVALGFFSAISEAATTYEEEINKAKDIVALEEAVPDFAAKVLNDTSVEEDLKYALVLKYSEMTDGEYGLSFACDCFDFLARTYAQDGSTIGNQAFIDFLLQKAGWCEFGIFPRYEDTRKSELQSQWSIIREQSGMNDPKLIADIESNINTLEK